ncbi:Monooxygenase [Fulvia fulva]|uniref:Monooxygenase n=1 Tax=Passalora fulva TaxID=5499 RepID=A0A9Q8LDE3_PASFU|nr:Monooxygenase [Fulvia fulva]KAK4629526.1 Monooxygenase [Fulvia fulva]KAK4630477.1 Monooxygenase [Fulvia fulva]UJO15363.1 Monooxygenase [Fulvia fulva]WPV12240.1 Monooxygenase [Fulvia fulva]WPV27619.1 Monooxygenase [Fulvia fulva]
MAFDPIFNPFTTRPKSQALRAGSLIPFLHTLRANFSLTTWLLFGAVLQSLLILLLPYKNLTLTAPAFGLLIYKTTRLALTCLGLLPNPGMDGVLNYRTVPVFPNEKGGAQDTPAGQTICAMLLSVRSNHPLGIFAPGFKETGDFFKAMISELNANATALGFLGSSSWLRAHDRETSSENMGFLHFENEQKLHDFAHGPLHTKALEWWTGAEGGLKHIGIMHEVFACPRNSWEGIYLNYHPTGLGATTKEVEVGGKKVWMSPLVKGKGTLNYSKGRMGRAFGSKEWEALDRTHGEHEKVDFGDEKV